MIVHTVSTHSPAGGVLAVDKRTMPRASDWFDSRDGLPGKRPKRRSSVAWPSFGFNSGLLRHSGHDGLILTVVTAVIQLVQIFCLLSQLALVGGGGGA